MWKMCEKVLNIFLICLISSQIINCLKSDDLTTDSSGGSTEEEEYEDLGEDQEQSLFEKIKQIYSESNNLTISLNVKHINETFEAMNKLHQNLGYLFKSETNPGLELMEFLSQINLQLSAQCSASLFKILTSIKNSEFWALKFLDSMGRFPPSGLMEGIQSSFGEYEECLDIRGPKTKDNDIKSIDGKYCLLNVKLPFPSMQSYADGDPMAQPGDFRSRLMQYYGLGKLSSTKSMIETLNLANGTIYKLGICIPSVCSPEEIEDTLNKIFYPITRTPLEVDRSCHMREQKYDLDSYTWLSIVIITVLILVVIISTGTEILANRRKHSDSESTELAANPSKSITFLLSFSLIKNTKTLFANNERFGALDTIRLLMILHIHLGHFYQYASSIGLYAVRKIFSDVMHKAFEDNSMVFARTPLPVDVLFTLSGFLLSYGLLRKLVKTKGRFNYLVFIFQRYIRFLVLVFGSILFFYIYPLTGSGPIWDEGVRKVIDGCKRPSNLLKNLLFINNFNNEGNNFSDVKCHAVTWFLAALLQLTAIAPIFVIIFFKKPIVGIYSIITAIILSVFAAVSPQLLFGIPPYLRIWELDSIIFSNSISLALYHTIPTVYLLSFLVGFPFGFMLFKGVRFSRTQEKMFWVLSIISIVTVYFWHNTFWRLDRSAPLISILLWHSIGKLFFCLGNGWIIYACCTGRAGYLNKILSWSGFQPIARLSFGIYLLHVLVVSHRVFSVKSTYEITFKYMLEHTFIDFIYDILLATIFYLIIESPFSNIFDAIFNPKPKIKKCLDENKNQILHNSKHFSIHL